MDTHRSDRPRGEIVELGGLDIEIHSRAPGFVALHVKHVERNVLVECRRLRDIDDGVRAAHTKRAHVRVLHVRAGTTVDR